MPGANPPRRTLAILGFFAAVLVVSTASGLVAAPSIHGWYQTLHQPPLSPPNWVFAPAWTILYLLMAWAASLAYATRPSSCRSGGLRMWGVQLIINFAWTVVFFRMHAPGFALLDILLLLIAIVQTLRPFHTIRPLAAWLLAPYLAWTLFAAYLNAGILLLNH
jgi:benzodiazapine receptor